MVVDLTTMPNNLSRGYDPQLSCTISMQNSPDEQLEGNFDLVCNVEHAGLVLSKVSN